jgi:outer membrane protein TolC
LVGFNLADAQELVRYSEVIELMQNQDNALKHAAILDKESLMAKAVAPLAPNQTSFSLSTEEFNFENNVGIQSLNFRQNFRMKNPRTAYQQLYLAQGSVVDQSLATREKALLRQVMETYIQAAYLRNLIAVEDNIQSRYAIYLNLAKRKAELGEESRLLERQIEQSFNQSVVERTALLSQKEVLVHMLETWLGKENIEVEMMDQVTIDSSNRSLDLHRNIQQLVVNKEVLEQQKNVILANNLPQVFTGFQLQRVNGSVLFFGAEVGMTIPLNKSFRNQQNTALQLSSRAIDEQIDWQRDQLELQRTALSSQAKLLLVNAQQIEDQLAQQQPLLNDLLKAFRFGEMTYAEVMLAYQNYFNLQKMYFDKLKQYYLKINELRHYVND